MPILACPYEGNEPVTLYCVKKMSENAGQEGGGSCSQPEGWIRSAHAECPQLDPPRSAPAERSPALPGAGSPQCKWALLIKFLMKMFSLVLAS